jgi:hypothetical protein
METQCCSFARRKGRRLQLVFGYCITRKFRARPYDTCGDSNLHLVGLKFRSSVMSIGKDSVLFLPVPKAMAMPVLRTCKAAAVPICPRDETGVDVHLWMMYAICGTRSTNLHVVLCLRVCSFQQCITQLAPQLTSTFFTPPPPHGGLMFI